MSFKRFLSELNAAFPEPTYVDVVYTVRVEYETLDGKTGADRFVTRDEAERFARRHRMARAAFIAISEPGKKAVYA